MRWVVSKVNGSLGEGGASSIDCSWQKFELGDSWQEASGSPLKTWPTKLHQLHQIETGQVGAQSPQLTGVFLGAEWATTVLGRKSGEVVKGAGGPPKPRQSG